MKITQYFPNPLFRKDGAQLSKLGNGTITYEAGGNHRFLQLQAKDTDGMQCALTLTGLPTGVPMRFTFAAYVPAASTSFRNDCLCVVGYGSWTPLSQIGVTFSEHLGETWTYSGEFTVPDGVTGIQLVFNSPKIYGQTVTIDNPRLMTKTDWDTYQAWKDRPSYLYWDLMPRS